MSVFSCQRACPLWWVPLILEKWETGAARPSCAACYWLARGRDTRRVPRGKHLPIRGADGFASIGRTRFDRAGARGCLARAYHECSNFRRSSSGRCWRWSATPSSDSRPRESGPCPVQVKGFIRRLEHPQGVQEGRSAAVECLADPLPVSCSAPSIKGA